MGGCLLKLAPYSIFWFVFAMSYSYSKSRIRHSVLFAKFFIYCTSAPEKTTVIYRSCHPSLIRCLCRNLICDWSIMTSLYFYMPCAIFYWRSLVHIITPCKFFRIRHWRNPLTDWFNFKDLLLKKGTPSDFGMCYNISMD